MKRLAAALGAVVVLWGAAAEAQTSTLLRMRYAVGRRARYTTRTTQTMPAPTGSTLTTVTTATHDVETVAVTPDGGATQRMRIARMDIAGPAIPAEIRARVASAMTGLTLEYAQDARGRVTTDRRAVGEVPAELRPMLDAVLDSLDQVGATLPEEPVAVGGTWRERRAIRVAQGAPALQMNVDTAYTLRQLRGAGAAQTAVIGMTMTITTPPGTTAGQVQVTGTGSATGETVVELGAGRTARGHTAGTLRMQVRVGGRAVDVETRFEHDMTPEAAAPAARAPARAPARPR